MGDVTTPGPTTDDITIHLSDPSGAIARLAQLDSSPAAGRFPRLARVLRPAT